jgi:hypothetical protein
MRLKDCACAFLLLALSFMAISILLMLREMESNTGENVPTTVFSFIMFLVCLGATVFSWKESEKADQ